MLKTLLNGNSVFEWPGQLRIDNDGQTVNELKRSGVPETKVEPGQYTLESQHFLNLRAQLRDPAFPGAIGI